MIRNCVWIAFCTLAWSQTAGGSIADDPGTLGRKHAALFARLALKGIQKEYPNKPGHVLNGPAEILGPRALHPAFYGSYDWHSSVHGHWLLVRLLRLFPDMDEAKQIRAVLHDHLTAKNLQGETEYFVQPNRQSFERTYGWAWLLKLAEELHGWDDPDAKQWLKNLKPLVDTKHATSRFCRNRRTRSAAAFIRTRPSGSPSPSTMPALPGGRRCKRCWRSGAGSISDATSGCRRRGNRMERTSSRRA
jgi:hypothetical protein